MDDKLKKYIEERKTNLIEESARNNPDKIDFVHIPGKEKVETFENGCQVDIIQSNTTMNQADGGSDEEDLDLML